MSKPNAKFVAAADGGGFEPPERLGREAMALEPA
jgi:hypothetical protein